MRGALYLVSVLMAASVAPAAAQQLAGPPPAAPDSPGKPAKHAAAHRQKAPTAVKRTPVPVSARLPTAPPPDPAEPASTKAAASSDPLSFGMKWNGSNESPGQTRIDNLGGSAVGTGAEVGMKLHF